MPHNGYPTAPAAQASQSGISPGNTGILSCLEGAAWRHVRRAVNLPLQALDNMRFVLLYGKNCLQQSPGIGMPCLLQLVAIQLFHDAAQLPY